MNERATHGRPVRLVATSTDEMPVEMVASVTPLVAEVIGGLIFQSRHNARGSVWPATGNTS